MNKRDHVLNGVLFGAGLGFLLSPLMDMATASSVIAVGVPVILGTLLPDVDTAFGSHRKTFHNLAFLAGFVAFPMQFGNLQYVWLGILSHYVLDLLGSRRGLALLYPWPREFELPVGVSTDSILAPVVTIIVTALELGIVFAAVSVAPDLGGLSVPPIVGPVPF